jgi:hypothetical protein
LLHSRDIEIPYREGKNRASGTTVGLAVIKLGTSCDGTDLPTANFDCVVVWTNAYQVYNSNFGTNLNNYVASGGNVVVCGAAFGNVPAITNFTYTNYSAFDYNGSQSNCSGIDPLTTVDHPTVNNILALDLGGAFFVGNISTTAGSTAVATWPSCSPNPGTAFIATKTSGSSKIVGFNLFLYTGLGFGGYPKYYKFLCNCVYWAAGNLS